MLSAAKHPSAPAPVAEDYAMNWVRYFERNRRYRALIPWELGVAVAPRLHAPLVRSLQHFQVGERGTGSHLFEAAERHGDPTYAEALFLFICEEQEHARLLAEVLRPLGANPVRRYWDSRAFTFLRRLAGLRGELFVLLAAEIIGARYYCALYEGISNLVLRAVFGQILRDEEAHLAFHRESLRRRCRRIPRALRGLLVASLHVCFRAVCLAAVADHRRALRAVGISPVRFVRECGYLYTEAMNEVLGAHEGEGWLSAAWSTGLRISRLASSASSDRGMVATAERGTSRSQECSAVSTTSGGRRAVSTMWRGTG